MRNIPLQAIPNQSLSVTIDSNRWDLRLKSAGGAMVIDVTLNGAVILQASRIAVGVGIIPFNYLNDSGNFILLVDNDELPNWEAFGTSQLLMYLAPGEIPNA